MQQTTMGSNVTEIETRRTVRQTFSLFLRIMAASAVIILAMGPLLASAQEEGGSSSTPVYFDETGQVLSGAFLDAWFDVGGPDRTGFPVTAPMKIGDNWVQWFEYSRLEVAADSYADANTDDVVAANVGLTYAQRFGYDQSHPAFKRVDGAGEGAEYFEETGHSLANAFLDSYNQGSNSDRLGLPISKNSRLTGKTYQFFERGAMSWTEDSGAVLVPVGTLESDPPRTTRQSGRKTGQRRFLLGRPVLRPKPVSRRTLDRDQPFDVHADCLGGSDARHVNARRNRRADLADRVRE
ncbi:MAG: hypothetical protein R2849_03010 [Thermomicrobiales bacterium]